MWYIAEITFHTLHYRCTCTSFHVVLMSDFCAASDDATLTRALLDDAAVSLHLLFLLSRAHSAWLLNSPASFSELQRLLTRVISTLSNLPFDSTAVARLSCAPLDRREVAQAAEPTTAASEPHLALHAGWFWVAAFALRGPSDGADNLLRASSHTLPLCLHAQCTHVLADRHVTPTIMPR
jgi:hypothetical protein